MENATKALLIAAAVLVAILIITLGLVVYNMASETIDSAGDLSEYQIQQFNEKFTKYEGENKSGSEVNAMLKAVFNHNQAQEDNSTKVSVGNKDYVTEIDKISKDMKTAPSKISTGYRYNVQCIYDDKSKLITHIKVTRIE